MIVPLHKGEEERTESKNYRGISLLSMVGKIYAGIFVDRVHRMNKSFIDNEQGSFSVERGCLDQIFTLKQISEKAPQKKHRFR